MRARRFGTLVGIAVAVAAPVALGAAVPAQAAVVSVTLGGGTDSSFCDAGSFPDGLTITGPGTFKFPSGSSPIVGDLVITDATVVGCSGTDVVGLPTISGAFTVTGGSRIALDSPVTAGTITIADSTVTANAGLAATGAVDITDSTVTAHGGEALPGIRGASVAIGGDASVVTATGGDGAAGDGGGAGIGGDGLNVSDAAGAGTTVSISGGIVQAQGGQGGYGAGGGAGIGGGGDVNPQVVVPNRGNGYGGDVTISGGTVTAIGGPRSPGDVDGGAGGAGIGSGGGGEGSAKGGTPGTLTVNARTAASSPSGVGTGARGISSRADDPLWGGGHAPDITPAAASAPLAYTVTDSGGTAAKAVITIGTELTFESNGGSALTPRFVAWNGTTGKAPTPTRAGYAFVGWYATPDLSGPKFAFGHALPADQTVYARWLPQLAATGVDPGALLALAAGTAAVGVALVAGRRIRASR